MNDYKLERIKERRAELKAEIEIGYDVESGLSFEERLIEKLIEAEERIAQLESYTSALAELAPTSGAALYTEWERYEYVEQFRAMGKEAKKLLPNEYKSFEGKQS